MAKEAPSYILNLEYDHERWEAEKFHFYRNPNSTSFQNIHQPVASKLTTFEEQDAGQTEQEESFDSDSSEKRKDRAWAKLNSLRMRPRKTLIRKEGQSNIAYRGIPQKKVKYLKDLYITLLDMKWRWAVLILCLGFFLSYFVFSIIYYLLSYMHGDLDSHSDPNRRPCIKNLDNYWDALLFSMETQSTIGYGTIYPNAECAGTVPTVFAQITIGFMLETLLLGFIFVKIARPKHRRHTLIFSRNACVCKEDSQLTLQVRIGDMRNSHLIDTHVQGMLVKRYVSQEKYVYPLFQHELEFEAHGMKDRVFLIWPLTLRHKITSESPLYTLTPEDLLYDKFELVLLLEGTIESTGEMVQARTSFTSREILWGHRFARLEDYDSKSDTWSIDFVRFNNVVPSKTPRCSAQDLDKKSAQEREELESNAVGDEPQLTSTMRRKTDSEVHVHGMNASADTLGSAHAFYSTASEEDDENV